jgi:hypothetical protein
VPHNLLNFIFEYKPSNPVKSSLISEASGKSFAFRIFIVALVLRLIPVILARGLGIGLDDMFQYDMLARSLASGNGFRWYAQEDLNQLAAYVHFDLSSVREYDPVRGIPTSFRAPLYPTFLALVYFFSGTGFSRFFAARLAQAIFLGAPSHPRRIGLHKDSYLSSFIPSSKEERRKKVERARVYTWIVACYPMLSFTLLGSEQKILFHLTSRFSLSSNLLTNPSPEIFSSGFFSPSHHHSAQ